MSYNFPNIYFTTLSIDFFQPVFKDFPMTNFFVLDSFNTIVGRGQVVIYAFVIMKDHLHIVWEVSPKINIDTIITSFKKYTGRIISNYIKTTNPEYQEVFISDRKDRERKIWNLKKGNINIHNKEMLKVKIKYTHNNPTRDHYKEVEYCTDYYFSSALAYSMQAKNFQFLTVLDDIISWC